MSSEPAALHGMCAVHGVGHIREKVAADGKEHLDVPVEHRVQRFHCVVAELLRWLKVEFLFQRVQEGLGRTFPNTHGAVTLYIRVPADTYGACAGTAHMPTHEQQIYDHLHVIDP